MLDKKERIIIILAISISAIMLVAIVIWRAAFFIPTPQFQTEHFRHEHPPSRPLTENTDEFAKTDIELNANYKLSLSEVIRAARTWGPAYKSWHGKTAPNFTLTDTTGKQHKLSDYRGKNVMIIFWAIWCRPCLMEIPHLIELRKTISQDKLAMLAITNERPEAVKKFVTKNKMNYTVLLDRGTLPRPYSKVNAIPSSFFIDPQGRIKLATAGLIPLNAIKDILQAESGY